LIAITLLTFVIIAPLLAVTAFFTLEIFAGLVPIRHRAPAAGSLRPSGVIVIPAHNEAAVISRTVGAVLAQVDSDYRLLVVAHNCSDRTADLARATGARVVVRDEPDLRGKGFALAAARDALRDDPPSVVVVLDADCRMDRRSLDALVSEAAMTGRACQAVNLLSPDLGAAPMVQISCFAFMIKNLIRQRGLQRLADRAHLTGTGMALPWPLFAGANLGGSNIVEDLALGLDLAQGSGRPMLVPAATVWSPAASASGTLVQRKRWEGGYLATALRLAPAAFKTSLMRADLHGLCAALDLSIPPLALLVLLNTAALVLALLAALAGGALWPALLQAALGGLAFLAIVLAWIIEGRKFASPMTLLQLPFYVLWKLPMYLGLVRRGAPKEWLRTGR
jgi:cellulose synthase/poly-beta-1,6-N-acetylglucosamine synthase-like glycosyltransferase